MTLKEISLPATIEVRNLDSRQPHKHVVIVDSNGVGWVTGTASDFDSDYVLVLFYNSSKYKDTNHAEAVFTYESLRERVRLLMLAHHVV